MNYWAAYCERTAPSGDMREMRAERGRVSIYRRIKHSPSFREVSINGAEQGVVITHGQDLTEKKIYSLPGQHLKHGGLVEFEDGVWLITELDADNQIYDKGIMQRCNHLLRWIGNDGTLREKWVIIVDGTKYLIGEKTESLMSIGDARIAMTVPKDEDTIELHRGMRFLIDDVDSDAVLAYQITKPNKLYNVYNGEGVYRFIMNEVNVTDADNIELRIADYTKWTPKKALEGDHTDSDESLEEIVEDAKAKAKEQLPDDKEGWL